MHGTIKNNHNYTYIMSSNFTLFKSYTQKHTHMIFTLFLSFIFYFSFFGYTLEITLCYFFFCFIDFFMIYLYLTVGTGFEHYSYEMSEFKLNRPDTINL